ncbi:MAG: NAD-binding protein, partial [Myxococcota bacterium]
RHGRWLFTFALAQGGEFGFVLVSFARQGAVLDEAVAGPLVAAIAVSMVVTPLLLLVVERFVLPRVGRKGSKDAEDEIEVDEPQVVIAGFGRFGQVVGRLLRANGCRLSVLDLDPDMVSVLRRVGLEVYYGDASRIDLLRAAGCGTAKMIVIAVDEPEKSLEITKLVLESFPDLPILARARNRAHFYELRHLGVKTVVRETFGSAVDLGIEALRAMGVGAHRAHRMAKHWRIHDETELEKLAVLVRGDRAEFFDYAKRSLQASEDLMKHEREAILENRDHGWDDESLRKEMGKARPSAG